MGLLVTFSGVHAQEHKKIDFIGGSLADKKMIFLAEMHTGEERAAFTHAMLRHLITQQGITKIVLETSASEAYLQNQYLHHADTTLFRYYPSTATRRVLDDFRQLNKELPADKQITIYGMDFERAEFVVAAKRIMELHGGGALLYINTCAPCPIRLYMPPT